MKKIIIDLKMKVLCLSLLMCTKHINKNVFVIGKKSAVTFCIQMQRKRIDKKFVKREFSLVEMNKGLGVMLINVIS